MIDIIKNIAEIVGALTVIITTFFAIEKFTKGKILNWLQKPIMNKLNEMDKRIDTIEVTQLKNIITNNNIPMSERLEARR